MQNKQAPNTGLYSKKVARFAVVMGFILVIGVIIFLCFFNTLWDRMTSNYAEKHYGQETVIGDFICQEYKKNEIYLKGLSEEGKTKEYVVIPNEINGKAVTMIGYQRGLIYKDIGKWESENLKKIYVVGEHYHFVREERVFSKCPNLEKIIFLNNKNEQYYDVVKDDWTVFMSKMNYNRLFADKESAAEDNEKSPYFYAANISFNYNYKNAPNNRYYWIDDVEDGKLIVFIPPDPIREGYEFQGWYKENDCINKWDFDNDRVQKANYHQEFKETQLFAKWEKIK
ncbi:MAG: InlB B-repeat-containing protein [Clostridia bacterium]|nr:InlB B-repeat-containing protein [Clostridia bacterium]